MTHKQKQILAEKFISAFSEVTNVPKDRIYLFFNGYDLDSCATGGKLFSEVPPPTAHAKFNADKWEKEDE